MFGPEHHLVGIVTTPDHPAPSVPTVILLNAGLVHRVGPHRLNVELARRLTRQGLATIRFDLSGIGDSERPTDEGEYQERALADISQVIDGWQEETGQTRFVIIGLCTGAYNALRAAGHDERVIGAVLIDGYSYPTFKYQLRHHARRLRQGWRWLRYLKRILGRGAGRQESASDDVVVFETEPMSRDDFGQRLRQLLDQGSELLFIYTGLGPQQFNYPRQLEDAFPELQHHLRERVVYLPDANHTFTLPDQRLRLIDEIDSWLAATFLRVPTIAE
jgi:pimeloyl-ACP methyl ester carboxylesterase